MTVIDWTTRRTNGKRRWNWSIAIHGDASALSERAGSSRGIRRGRSTAPAAVQKAVRMYWTRGASMSCARSARKRMTTPRFRRARDEIGRRLDRLRAAAVQEGSWPTRGSFWALPYLRVLGDGAPVAPEGDWRSRVILGGRGAGKTRAGAEWVRSGRGGAPPRPPVRRMALVGETLTRREVMIFGERDHGVSSPDRRPVGRQCASGRSAERRAQAFSAHDPESLRAAIRRGRGWAGEVEARGGGGTCCNSACVWATATPMRDDHAAQRAGAEAAGGASTVTTLDGGEPGEPGGVLHGGGDPLRGTRLGAQELEGRLWRMSRGVVDSGAAGECRGGEADLARIVVADPPVTRGRADTCGSWSPA